MAPRQAGTGRSRSTPSGKSEHSVNCEAICRQNANDLHLDALSMVELLRCCAGGAKLRSDLKGGALRPLRTLIRKALTPNV